jgi:uncharacterized membrane protein YkvA (DUF1232 family)
MTKPCEPRAIVPYLPEGREKQKARMEAGFWRKVRRLSGRVPFLEDVAAAYFCATDSRTPTRVKGVLIAALAYFVVPTDLIPDFIATLGFTDDAAVLFAAIQTVAPHVKDDHRVRARDALQRLSGETDPIN